MTYEMPTNITGMTDLITWTDSVTGGWYGNGILMAFWIVVFMVTKKADTKRGFAVASFMTSLIGIMLRSLDMISDSAIVMPIVATGIAVLWLVWDRK